MSISGSFTDDGGMAGLTVSYDGPGTFSFDENGNFIVNMGSPEGSGTATITVMDANGQMTTYTFTY